MEGVLALMIPIVAVGGFFAWMITLSPVGKAYADKLRGHKASTGDGEGQEELLESVEQLRREVAELAERVDFTERLLGQQRGGERIGPPRP
jgi:aldehyde:ferredoxin oxidoreductase